MFGNNFTLFEFLGFRVRANVSWLFLAVLVTWSLAAGYFPGTHPGLSQGVYWSLGIVGTIGIFFSLLFHEFSHSLVARTRGLEISGITLFLFGGVAEMPMEPDTPKTEFWMAIAGPIASVFLGGAFYLLAALLETLPVPGYVAALAGHVGFVNLVLAAFNMVPGFPLDGGRVLRAVLWHFRGDLEWATRWATRLGQGFGIVLSVLGIANALAGGFTGGLWWFLIGLFLYGAATASYRQLLAQRTLRGKKVRDIMTRDPVTVDPDITVQRFIDDYLYRYSHDLFPVVSHGRLRGCVGLKDVKELSHELWESATVSRIARDCTDENTIGADQEAEKALELMQKTESSRLMVTDGARLIGVLSLKDLLHRLQIRTELENAA